MDTQTLIDDSITNLITWLMIQPFIIDYKYIKNKLIIHIINKHNLYDLCIDMNTYEYYSTDLLFASNAKITEDFLLDIYLFYSKKNIYNIKH